MILPDVLKSLIVKVIVVFSLCYYSHLYFFDFDQGISSAPGSIKALKDIFLVLVSALIVFTYKIKRPAHAINLLAAVILTQLLIGFFLAEAKVEFALSIKNFVLAAVGALALFAISAEKNQFAKLALTFSTVMVAQAIWVYALALFFPRFDLWKFSEASGLIGNPNTFAFCLNLAIAFSLSVSSTYYRLFAFFACSCAILLSNSVSGLLVLIFGSVLILIVKQTDRIRYLCSAALVFGFVGALHLSDIHHYNFEVHRQLIRKALGLAAPSQMPDTNATESLSFSGRRVQYREAITFLEKPQHLAFGSAVTGKYKVYDGQYLQLLVNYGFVTFLLYLYVSFQALMAAVRSRRTNDLNTSILVAAAVVLTTQVFSHLIDYFPANLFVWYVYLIASTKDA